MPEGKLIIMSQKPPAAGIRASSKASKPNTSKLKNSKATWGCVHVTREMKDQHKHTEIYDDNIFDACLNVCERLFCDSDRSD
jgi:hypothetical protein